MGVVARSAAWLIALLAASVLAVIVAGGGALPGAGGPRAGAPPATAPGAAVDPRVVPAAGSDSPAPSAPDPAAGRALQVAELLDRRATAVLTRDREGFLAGIDPAATEFRDRQSALFDALADVPLATWSYDLDRAHVRDATGLPERHGADVWVPQVVLRYSFAGVPGRPTAATQVLTFVERDGRWLLASDSDFDTSPVPTARALWDSGPVVVVRGRHALVLGHPESRGVLAELAEQVDAAVPRVSRVWGDRWSEHVVVLVPRDEPEMRRVVGDELELAGVAAVATAQLVGGTERYDPVGDRVVVHPVNWAGLGPLGERVVLTHEVAHVAARRVSGPALPIWLAEGLADYVAYDEAGVPVERAAPRTARAVRDGDVPARLPTAEDFAGPDVARAYETSWLAVLHLADRHGEDALLRLYRRIGSARPGADPETVVAEAFSEVLGTSAEAFTATWRDDLRRRFA